ncbi:arylsulfatase [Rhodopirellula halodulae]|uniref:arylsulfatase n=1 Tax=Rhodopirellula halodulae TaxID=2894198 RepID=UPI001E61689F|nr:arylsulfatase [Rhodopirellula sp. JC737]MCC9656600.1 arylsulfatase [Rhodopirellula sp. JC737]
MKLHAICAPWLMVLVVSVLGLSNTWAASPQPPNIVLVLVDDMGFSDLGCYGSEIETPNIDALATNGLRFTQFYNSGRCCPTRASLMTGLHPHQVGIGHMTAPPNQPYEGPPAYQGHLNETCTTIPEVLRGDGYHTFMTGKWHLGHADKGDWPMQRGFDRFYGGISGAFNYFKPGGDRGMTDGNQDVTTGDDFYATDAFTEIACDYIKEATAKDDKPFFLYLAYNSPHWPLNAKVKDFEKYRGKYRGGWDAVMAARQQKQRELGLFESDVEAAPHVGPDWASLTEKQRDNLDAIMAAYAGCIDNIDQNIGKLVAHLKSIGQYDNTLILFLSDNGACQEGGKLGFGSEDMVRNPPLETTNGVRLGLAWANACNTPFRLYKHFLHEGGANTPFIAHWPAGIPQSRHNTFVRQPAYLPDVMATCVELAAATMPGDVPPCEGVSFASALTGGEEIASQPIHAQPMFFEHEGNAMMRAGDWKLVREYKKPWELYNLSEDRTELNDLSTAQSQRRDRMIAAWEDWATKTEVMFPERFNMYQHLKEQKKKKK